MIAIAVPETVFGGAIAGSSRGVAATIGFGMLLGFRFGGGLVGALNAFVLAVSFGLKLCWPTVLIGVKESVNTQSTAVVRDVDGVLTAIFAPLAVSGFRRLA